MFKALLPDQEFIELFRAKGASEIARETGGDLRTIFKRRKTLERKYHITIDSPAPQGQRPAPQHHPERIQLSVTDGVVLVGSDGHYWPGDNSIAHRAFVRFVKDMRPKAVIFNGDSLDAATISRHPPIGWNRMPTVQEEIEVCQEKLGEIEAVKPMKCRLLHPLGNHDARYEMRIATVAPEYANVHGTSLQDHFPAWEPCWSVWINGDVVVKHRWRAGMHGVHNNTVNAGKTMITGHDHALRVSPYSDYNGTRWGVSTGTLADPYAPQFLYLEDNPRGWRAGFIALTFVRGTLLWPEIIAAVDEKTVEFRGEYIKI